MNITVNVDEVSLSTAVGQVFGYDSENDEAYSMGDRTLADIVAAQIVQRLVKHESYYDLTRTVFEVRREVMAELVRPSVEEAISKPIRKTNGYGETVGETTVTLREVIVDEARKVINSKDPNDYRGDKGTFLVRVVREEVSSALRAEIADAVKEAKAAVAGEIGKQVASAVTAAMKAK